MRALRHRLREYLARVEAGERFEITLFGRAVARLELSSRQVDTLERLIADGRVTPALDPDTRHLPKPMASMTATTATAALLAERAEDDR